MVTADAMVPEHDVAELHLMYESLAPVREMAQLVELVQFKN
jgi:hypothetical protein